MNSESNGQHIIFIIILISIFSLSYYAIPLPESVDTIHKISKKAQTKVLSDKEDTTTSKNEISIVKKSAKSEPDTIKDQAQKVLVQPMITKVEELKVEELKVEELKVEELKVEELKVEELKVETKTDKWEKGVLTDIIVMNNPGYKKHTKGIIEFTHKKHVETYLITCGRCHHDETGKPLELTVNDNVQGCIECHKETEKPKGEKLGEKEKIAKYHFEALHTNCIDCHKEYNKEKGDPKGKVPAPTSCTKCHPKE